MVPKIDPKFKDWRSVVLASLEWGEEEIFRFLLNVAEHDQSLRNAIEQNIDEVLIGVFKTKAKAR